MSSNRSCPKCRAILPAHHARPGGNCPECGALLPEDLLPEDLLPDDQLPVDRRRRGGQPAAGQLARRRAADRMAEAREQERSNTPQLAIAGAIGGALAGALAWAIVAYATHTEIGWIAWGIGLLTGGACARLGGRGQGMAMLSAALALAAILVGKLLATHLVISAEVDKIIEAQMTPAVYADLRADWTTFAALPEPPPEADLRRFLIEHGYSDADTPEEIPDQQVAEFRQQRDPWLRAIAARNPTIEQWRDDARAEIWAEVPLFDAMADDLGALDLLFAVLGVTTAFGLVMKMTAAEATARRQEARAERAREHEAQAPPPDRPEA